MLHLLKGGKSSLPMIISGMFSCEDVLFCVVTEHPDISNTPKANKNGITAMYLDFMLCTSTIFSDFFGFYVIIITLFILNLHKRYNTKHAQNVISFTRNSKFSIFCSFIFLYHPTSISSETSIIICQHLTLLKHNFSKRS